jgi:hypothetical protein
LDGRAADVVSRAGSDPAFALERSHPLRTGARPPGSDEAKSSENAGDFNPRA